MIIQRPVFETELAETYERRGYWSHPFLVDVLEGHAIEAPDRLALVDDADNRVTYREFHAAVTAGAAWLADRGLVRGDCLVLALPNSIDYAVAYFAAGRLGVTAVVLSSRESGKDIAFAAEQTGARGVLVPAGARASSQRRQLVECGVAPESVAVVGTRDASDSEFDGWPGWQALIVRDVETIAKLTSVVQQDDIDFIVFTSGTTGRPKGIAHTYAGAAASLWNWTSTLGLAWTDGVFAPATFGHVGGLQWGLRTAVAIGAPVVIMDRWDPSRAAEIISAYGCTYTLVTPTYLTDLANLPEEHRALTSGFRYWTVGGSRMSADFVVRAERALGGMVLRGFGMSECFMATITRPDDPANLRAEFDGRPLPGCELQIRDQDGRLLPPGVPGDLFVRSPSLVGGYFTDPAETKSAFVDGWFSTGDMALLSEDGFMSVVDRKKEIVIRGGENISPQEVEQVIATLSGLPPFAITGVPDERLGEKLALLYEGEPNTLSLEGLRDQLASTGLAKYKWPEIVIAVDALPRTALGKIQRGSVKELVRQMAEFNPST